MQDEIGYCLVTDILTNKQRNVNYNLNNKNIKTSKQKLQYFNNTVDYKQRLYCTVYSKLYSQYGTASSALAQHCFDQSAKQ